MAAAGHDRGRCVKWWIRENKRESRGVLVGSGDVGWFVRRLERGGGDGDEG